MATGSKDDPWVLKTPPGSSEYTMYRDEQAEPALLVCQVGSTKLTYDLRAIEDLHHWLAEQGDWVPLGAADEKKAGGGRHGGGVGALAGQPASAAGTASARATGAASACTSRPSWRRSAWPSSPTTRATTACAPSDSTTKKRSSTMPTTKVIRYRTKPEHADENERLVRDVFAELAETRSRRAALRRRSASTTA